MQVPTPKQVRNPISRIYSTGISNQDANDHKSKNSPRNSQKKTTPDQSLVADKMKPPPDDFTKAQTRTCSIPECAKSSTIPLKGDKGTKWYQDKGLFLPKRCQECIQSGRTNWKPKPPTESQLSQAGHLVDDPTADPDAVDSLPADHRNDHLHKLCPCDTHSLLTASNSNRESLAHAV